MEEKEKERLMAEAAKTNLRLRKCVADKSIFEKRERFEGLTDFGRSALIAAKLAEVEKELNRLGAAVSGKFEICPDDLRPHALVKISFDPDFLVGCGSQPAPQECGTDS